MRAVGQTYAGMGAFDPRLNRHGALDFRLTVLNSSWSKSDDPPPRRVKPLPLTLLTQTVTLAAHEHTAVADTAADCLIIGFYFLLRPGEYLGTPNETTPDNLFCLRNLTLWVGSRALDLFTSPLSDLQAATFAAWTACATRRLATADRATLACALSSVSLHGLSHCGPSMPCRRPL